MKLGNLYNLRTVKNFRDSLKGREGEIAAGFAHFGDAASTGLVLARNLTHVDPRIFEKKYPSLVFLNSGFEARNEGGYVDRVQSLRTNIDGEFRGVNDKSSDKGAITISAEQSVIPVYSYEGTSTWTLDDIKRAELQGIRLVDRLLSAHDELYKRKIDSILAVGDSTVGIQYGLLNNASFSTHAAAGAASTLTGAALYQELADLINFQHNAVSNTPEYMATHVMMPVRVFNQCQNKIYSADGYSTKTVLTALRENFPGITWLQSPRCEDAILVSEVAKSSTVAYSVNAESSVIRIPTPFELSEVYKNGGFQWGVDSKFRVAGLDVLESTSAYILTGL